MSSSTPQTSSGASAAATATASDDRHLPQLKTLKEKTHLDHSPGNATSVISAMLSVFLMESHIYFWQPLEKYHSISQYSRL